MKHLFFVAVAIGIFSGTSNTVRAQANVNLEQITSQSKTKTTPKFIENIEISPQAGYTVMVENTKSVVVANTGNIAAASINPTSTVVIEHCNSLQFKYAMMMDMEVESLTNTALYSFIDEWWATRYHYGGTDKSGIDCSAFTGKLLSVVFNINAPRTARDQYDVCDKITREDLQEGDLVFFNTRGGVSHVGLYLGNNYFVHSSVSSGVTITNLTDDYYSRKFICGGRMKK